ncbi:fibroblast growth factor receptor 3-like isoform X1 [Cimex lectularius]|uniref:Ig-like domain-containing protein n=1 Tax=Cimex lectularius TaxID=79782 RepID=A0A8I6TIG2_CIMLE|nr:fibroblast growth factor receptor 3-like isoform X1 [Cimex lectularius]
MLFISPLILLFVQIVDNVNCAYVKPNLGSSNRVWNIAFDPVFESSDVSVSAAPGETALLPCKVRNLGDKAVSWMRRRDLHIISFQSYIYTADSRFKVAHRLDDPDSWNLQINNITFNDDGVYDCQINTEPIMKRPVRLSVTERPQKIEPEIREMKDDSGVYGTEGTMILGQKERFIKVGSTLTLTCHSRSVEFYHMKGQRPTRLVDWLQDDKIIIFDQSRSGVSVDTEKDGRDLSSQLTLASVNLSDSGKYTCKPYNSEAYSIKLVVVEGERTEAMQSDQAGDSTVNSLSPIALFVALIFTLVI